MYKIWDHSVHASSNGSTKKINTCDGKENIETFVFNQSMQLILLQWKELLDNSNVSGKEARAIIVRRTFCSSPALIPYLNP